MVISLQALFANCCRLIWTRTLYYSSILKNKIVTFLIQHLYFIGKILSTCLSIKHLQKNVCQIFFFLLHSLDSTFLSSLLFILLQNGLFFFFVFLLTQFIICYNNSWHLKWSAYKKPEHFFRAMSCLYYRLWHLINIQFSYFFVRKPDLLQP